MKKEKGRAAAALNDCSSNSVKDIALEPNYKVTGLQPKDTDNLKERQNKICLSCGYWTVCPGYYQWHICYKAGGCIYGE